MNTRLPLLIVTVVLASNSPSWVSSAVIEESTTLAPGDPVIGQSFGSSAAIGGDWIAIGAPGDDEYGTGTGAVYVFRRVGTSWIQHEKLKGFRIAYEQLGYSVAFDGDWLVAGAPDLSSNLGGTPGPGRAYVFRRDDRGSPDDTSDDRWEVVAILYPPPSHLGYGLGLSVDIANGVIVAGTMPTHNRVGRAYPFRWDGSEWLPAGILMGSDTEAGDNFGNSVATNGTAVAVTASRDGSVYIFEKDGAVWTQRQKLTSPDQDPFGGSVAMHGSTMVVGQAGGVHLFEHDGATWGFAQRLIPADPVLATFGRHVAIDDDSILVGSKGEFWGYLFELDDTGWNEVQRLVGLDAISWHPVAVSGRYALVSTYVYAVGETITLPDYAAFQRCFGAGDPVPVECQEFDLEPDRRIDLADHALLLQTFRGP